MSSKFYYLLKGYLLNKLQIVKINQSLEDDTWFVFLFFESYTISGTKEDG